jgi:predicted HTH domain antitoxin
MTEQLNIRIDKNVVQEFEDLAKQEHLDRAALVKKALIDGLQQERLNFAVQKYALQEISVERAAEIAKISIHEMLAILSRLGVPSNMNLDDFQKLARLHSSTPE